MSKAVDQALAFQRRAIRAEAENERLRRALASIKARCDRIVAGEFGGLTAAIDMSNEVRRALRPTENGKGGRSVVKIPTCDDCADLVREFAEGLPYGWRQDVPDVALHIACGITHGSWACEHVDWTWEDAAAAYSLLWRIEVRRRDVLRDALELVGAHARLDEHERGIGEASRYRSIAENAIRERAGLPTSCAYDRASAVTTTGEGR